MSNIKLSTFYNNWQFNVWPHDRRKGLRYGQSFMNFLGEFWPLEYDRISSNFYGNKNTVDCYYNNELIDNTVKHLSEVWSQFPN